MKTTGKIKKITIGALLLLFAACSQQPAEIHYQSDECAHCKMMIMDPRFASQMVTETGKAYKFDAIECMEAYLEEGNVESASAKLWVNDFNNPGNWLDASEAIFIKSEVIQSPMGSSLLALESQQAAAAHLEEYPGETLSWDEL
ncbi:nitrous oxide reductase accessory protein NosL [Aliifodinibius sp. S!AR15-10]|uniref:nitrous oxide reductase accessory protein NosL n=1 Tax=Aliifodinibius sp. S!AR15-10 TaxID=2950437 RepID=UPI0028675798|nr:nitrous oxide reductase accessory protein NosL [Aliifodinibius sp. S!AR15-10]MDR8393181.1 nitrous oxide reductase accessory protein NosL [Aliifodinibius sp. S!AR15-10]